MLYSLLERKWAVIVYPVLTTPIFTGGGMPRNPPTGTVSVPVMNFIMILLAESNRRMF
jgi:hypothetical protein